MKISYRQLQKIIEATKDNPNLLRCTLKRIFSYKENIDVFSYYFFPHACIATIPKFHYEVHDWLFKDGDGALAAPRGHAKSTVVGLIFIIFCIVNKLEDYIVYTSQSYSKTVQFIEPLMTEFLENKRLKFVYGELTPKKETDDKGKFREDIIDVNKIRIQAASFEKNIRGFKYRNQRPTLIIMDDVEDDQRVLNPELRMKDAHKLNKIIIPSLDPVRGRLKIIGTILHWDSLLIKKIRLYNGTIYKSCTKDFEDILWPAYWTEERLRAKKKSIGSVAFSSEFLNNPIENDASLIKFDWIKDSFDHSLSYGDVKAGDQKKLGCDFAFGDRATNDNSAYCGVIKKDNKKYINELHYYKGLTIITQFNMLEEIYKKGKYDEVVMEENSIKSLSADLHNYSMKYYLIWTGATDPPAKLKGDVNFNHKRHTVGKKSMILRLATEFENGNIILPYKTPEDQEKSNKLAEELMTFALDNGKLVEVGIHADGPIALSMALERMQDTGVIIDW